MSVSLEKKNKCSYNHITINYYQNNRRKSVALKINLYKSVNLKRLIILLLKINITAAKFLLLLIKVEWVNKSIHW